MENDKYLTVYQAAKLTGKSSSTIKRLADKYKEIEDVEKRTLLKPSPQQLDQLRSANKQFKWLISTRLLREEFGIPDVEQGTAEAPKPKTPRAAKALDAENQLLRTKVELLEQHNADLRADNTAYRNEIKSRAEEAVSFHRRIEADAQTLLTAQASIGPNKGSYLEIAGRSIDPDSPRPPKAATASDRQPRPPQTDKQTPKRPSKPKQSPKPERTKSAAARKPPKQPAKRSRGAVARFLFGDR